MVEDVEERPKVDKVFHVKGNCPIDGIECPYDEIPCTECHEFNEKVKKINLKK